jgi:regulatory protein
MNSKKTYTVDEALKLLENYCVYQERCHKDVEQKLFELKLIPEAKEKILLHLMKHNFLNEERFAKAFVRGKFLNNNWGKQKIINELKFKNLSTYTINSGLKEIDEYQYKEKLQNLAQKKLVLLKEPNKYKKRTKLAQYLIAKGYESNLVYDVCNNLVH